MDHENMHHTNEEHYHDVKTLLSWQAPGRPFKERSKEYFLNAFFI